MKFTLLIDPNKEEAVTVTAHAPSELTAQLEALVLSHCGTDKLTAYRHDRTVLLQVSQIECITVLQGKTYAIDTTGEHYHLKQRLCQLEEQLPSWFIRINKSTLANERQLEGFKASFSGAVDALFCCGHREYVSRRCFAQLKRRFQIK